MIAYAYNDDGRYAGTVTCQKDPVRSKREERDVYLLPANATLIAPPEFDPATQNAVWDGEAWRVEDILEPVPEPEPEPTQLDRIEAQVIYTAMMTDTLLEV